MQMCSVFTVIWCLSALAASSIYCIASSCSNPDDRKLLRIAVIHAQLLINEYCSGLEQPKAMCMNSPLPTIAAAAYNCCHTQQCLLLSSIANA